jgi:hypothetical protein
MSSNVPVVAQHTPGPWATKVVESTSTELPRTLVYDATGVPICVVGGMSDKAAQFSERAALITADARLIAAAPDMLASLKDCAEVFAQLEDVQATYIDGAAWAAVGRAALKRVDAIIAKAVRS